MALTLGNLIRDLRLRLNDSPYGNIPQRYTDADLTTFINNSRRKMSVDLQSYSNQDYIIPTAYKDEYDLPSDYLKSDENFDQKQQINYPPANRANVTTTKNQYNNQYYNNYVTFGNFTFIDENRRKLTLYTPPEKDKLEPVYLISEFNRAGNFLVTDGLKVVTATGTVAITTASTTMTGTATKFMVELTVGDTVVINSVSYVIATVTSDTIATLTTIPSGILTGQTMTIQHYVFANIIDWDKVKGYAKLSNAAGTKSEYIRVSKIVQTATSAYTLWVSSWDVKNAYKNNIVAKGVCNVLTTSAIVRASNSAFMTEIAVGDRVNINNEVKTVNVVSNNYAITVNTAFTANANSQVAYITGLPLFVDNDTLQYTSYVINYNSIAPELTLWNEIDRFPNSCQDLIVVLAASEAELRRGRPQEAQIFLTEYNTKIKEIDWRVKQNKSDAYNKGLVY